MGKGGKRQVSRSDQDWTWDEIRLHNKRNDRWLVIDNEVYDITEWSRRHPGGSKVIGHYAGQDASEAFRAFHNDPTFVRKYMKAIHIGHVTDQDNAPKQATDEEAIRTDFEALRQKAYKMGLFKPSITFFILTVLQLVVFEVLAYLVMYRYGTGWLPWIASIFLMATAQAQAGWSQHDFGHLSVFRQSWLNHALHHLTVEFMKAQAGWSQHDFGHLSVFKSTWVNHALHQFTMCIMKGASCDWWNHMHYQHHAKPNVIHKDPDVRLDVVFVVGETIPKRVAKEKKSIMPYNWQHQYFFAIGPPLLFPLYFQFMIFRHAITRRRWIDMCTMMFFYGRVAYLYSNLLGVGGFLLWYFLVRVVESHWFVWVTQSNHIPMEIDDDKERPWLALQLHATCDIEKSFFNDWFTGHLNHQIEHHLFPTMPRHNLYKIQPEVEKLCKKHNIPFSVKPIGKAFWDIIRSLQHSGEIWHHYYTAYHS